MVSDSTDLPFFPKYETEYLYEDKIRVTWFESHFSQSHYNVHNISKGSNACTLIAVLMAAKCNQYKVVINGPHKCLNVRLIQLLAASMLEGNRIHEELKLKNVLKHVNLNVPEAIAFGGKQTTNMVEWFALSLIYSCSKVFPGTVPMLSPFKYNITCYKGKIEYDSVVEYYALHIGFVRTKHITQYRTPDLRYHFLNKWIQ